MAAAEDPAAFLKALALSRDNPDFALWFHPALIADPFADSSPDEIAIRVQYQNLIYQAFLSTSGSSNADEEKHPFIPHSRPAFQLQIPIVDPIFLYNFPVQPTTNDKLDESLIFPPLEHRWDPLADPYIPEGLPAMSGVRAKEDGELEIVPPLDLLLEATEKFKSRYVGFRDWIVVASREEVCVFNYRFWQSVGAM
jgi:hypothetical protein